MILNHARQAKKIDERTELIKLCKTDFDRRNGALRNITLQRVKIKFKIVFC